MWNRPKFNLQRLLVWINIEHNKNVLKIIYQYIETSNRKTERQKDRRTERQKDRKTEKKERKTERRKDRKKERKKDRKKQTNKERSVGIRI